MKPLFLSAAISAALLSLAPQINAADAHWGYTGEAAPERWGDLAPEYRLCREGKNQSPVDIVGTIEANLPPITIQYTGGQATEILNNGHTVQAVFPSGSSIVVDGVTFELKQIHFHTPSENRFLGVSYPMEAHLVHTDAAGNLAVIGVMMSEGAANPAIAKLWAQMPKNAGDRTALAGSVKADELLPANRDYFRFNGSLTTPPCTEGVRWLVLKNSVTVSAQQIEAFSHLMHHPNNRPIQPANARPLLR